MKTYFISDGTRVKIGKSIDPRRRLSDLQTAHPSDLVLLLVVEGDREKELHARFIKEKQRGEWFSMSPEIQAFIAEAVPTSEGVSEPSSKKYPHAAASRLMYERKTRHLSQIELSRIVKVPQSVLSLAERRILIPSDAQSRRLEEWSGLPIAELLKEAVLEKPSFVCRLLRRIA